MAAVIGEKVLFVKHNQDKTAVEHYFEKESVIGADQRYEAL